MIYRAFFRVLIVLRVGAEMAHRIASWSLRILMAPRPILLAINRLRAPDPALGVRAMGLEFRTPLGCAAGVDKSATWFDPLHALGFGFVEVGTITARPQQGNQKPRVARLPRDRALLNAMGFPNDGAAAASRRLARRRLGDAVIGVNIGKTRVVELSDAITDYRESVRRLATLADYIVLNVSSPNTPGLATMQTADCLESLVRGVQKEAVTPSRRVPMLVKIGADLPDGDIDAIADVAVKADLDGIVSTNTTVDMEAAPNSTSQIAGLSHAGGLSGPPLKSRAVEILSRLHDRVGGQVTLISVGGIETPKDAWERILAGATLVQAHTAFVYGGPLWPHRMNRGIARLLRDSEFNSIAAAIGGGVRSPNSTPSPEYSSYDHPELASPVAGRL